MSDLSESEVEVSWPALAGLPDPGGDRRDTRGVSESWMLDELAHAGPEHLDEAFIAGYDRKQGYPDPEEDLAAFGGNGLDGRSVIVDLGAGTGQFAVPAARRFGGVIAADVSPAMLAAIRGKAAGLDNLAC